MGPVVALALVLGSIPLFLGLIVVMPVLGHATWHLYRRVVAAVEEPCPSGRGVTARASERWVEGDGG